MSFEHVTSFECHFLLKVYTTPKFTILFLLFLKSLCGRAFLSLFEEIKAFCSLRLHSIFTADF